MNLYGTKIDIEGQILKAPGLDVRLAETLVRKSKERTYLLQFLSTAQEEGGTVFSKIVGESSGTGTSAPVDVKSSTVIDFATRELKEIKFGEISLYEYLIRLAVEKADPKFQRFHNALDRRKATPVPQNYPTIRNKMQILIDAKLHEEEDSLVSIYLQRRKLEARARELAHTMFFGINNLDLEGEELIKFMQVMYQLKDISEADIERQPLLMQKVGAAIRKGTPIQLINLKCLRMTYPNGKNLKLVTHMGDEVVVNKDGREYHPPKEDNYCNDLSKIEQVFTSHGIKAKTIILTMDIDIQDHFPQGGVGLVPEEDLSKAKEDVLSYTDCIQSSLSDIDVSTFSRYLEENNLKRRFEDIRKDVLLSLAREDERYVSRSIVETRVQYRFSSNNRIFESRDNSKAMTIARFSAYNQLATLIALQVLAGDNVILVVEDRGIENKFMGGRDNKDLPIVFVELSGKK